MQGSSGNSTLVAKLRGKVETFDDLILVILDESKPDQVVNIDAQLLLAIKTQLAVLLQELRKSSHGPMLMPGFDPEVIVHMLNDDQNITEKVQAKRTFYPERYLTINEEIEKLLVANFI